MSKYLMWLWVVLSLLIGFEYYRLNAHPEFSFLFWLQTHHILSAQYDLSTWPGRSLSLWLGYTGFTLMLLSNIYILRRNLSSWHRFGILKNWLDFHIFCGLMGPTLIVLHSDFKVRGLVAISFWSMLVSVASGFVGRYLYVRIYKLKASFTNEAEMKKSKALESLTRAMGYWHTFHMPFALFMYVAAVIHIGVEIWLGAAW